MFLLVVTDYVDQPEVVPTEEQSVEIFPVHSLTSSPALHCPHQAGHHSARPLHQVVEVPRREEDPGLVALVGVDGVVLVPTANLVVSSLAAKYPSKEIRKYK